MLAFNCQRCGRVGYSRAWESRKFCSPACCYASRRLPDALQRKRASKAESARRRRASDRISDVPPLDVARWWAP